MYQNKPRGGLLPELDNEQPFQAHFVEPIATLIRQLKGMLGDTLHSVYLSGDIALRTAGDVSDLPLTLVTTRALNVQEFSSLNTVRFRVEQSSNAVKRVQMDVIPLKDVTDFGNIFRWGFFFKHCAVCVYGENLGRSFGHFEVSWEVAKAMNSDFEPRMRELRQKIAQATKWGTQLDAAQDAAEKLINASFGLVAHKEQMWAHDLKTASEVFLTHHPEKALEIERLFYLIDRKPVKKRAVVALLDSFGAWIISEYSRIDRKIG